MDRRKNKSILILDKRVKPGIFLLIGLGVLVYFFVSSSPVVIAVFLFFLFLHMAFFRDPVRYPAGAGVVSPADGKVVEVSFCDEPRYLRGKAIKIGIFLSVLDVHVNRMPWPGTLEWQEYVPGRFLNALDPDAALKNESNWLGFRDGNKTFVVRQISGLIARHIHCDIQKGEKLKRCDKIGMICYGSRAEVYLPADQFDASVRLGDAVKTAETLLGSWKA